MVQKKIRCIQKEKERKKGEREGGKEEERTKGRKKEERKLPNNAHQEEEN